MLITDFLFFHANLLGRRRDTLWQEGWLGAFYVVSAIVAIWLFAAMAFIEAHWGLYLQGSARHLIYMALPLLTLLLLALRYKHSESHIMTLWEERTTKHPFLQLPSYLVLFVYFLLSICLLMAVM